MLVLDGLDKLKQSHLKIIVGRWFFTPRARPWNLHAGPCHGMALHAGSMAGNNILTANISNNLTNFHATFSVSFAS
jgi:hypothetical protein